MTVSDGTPSENNKKLSEKKTKVNDEAAASR